MRLPGVQVGSRVEWRDVFSMSYSGCRMEIITEVERRRRWSAAEELRIIAVTKQPGAGIAEIARQYEISRGLLWNCEAKCAAGC